MGRVSKRWQRVGLLAVGVQVSCLAQTASLSLSSSAVAPGGATSLNLSLSGLAGPAGIQWNLTYPAGAVTAVTVTPGPVLTAAGKTLYCTSASGTYRCLAIGQTGASISDGVLAFVNVTASSNTGAATFGIASTAAVSGAALVMASSGAGGTLNVVAPVSLSLLTCNPSSLTTPGNSTCTATLSAAAPSGGATVNLSSNNTSLAVPPSVSVAAGSTSAGFSVTAPTVVSSQGALVTATLGTVSQTASVTLMPPAPSAQSLQLSSVSCSPSSLSPAGTSTCVAILSGTAPAGGAALTVTSNNASIAAPASVTVPAGATSATFVATEGSATSSQAAVMTVALGSSTLTDSLVLNPAGGPSVLAVGAGQKYTTPCQALTAAPDGAVVQIAAALYSADVCTITANNLTVQGINGRPKIDAAALNAGGKGTWVFEGNDITIDTVELTGATNPGQNGAGIVMDGRNLILRNSYLHDNQEGLRTSSNRASQVLIAGTEFNHNGFGDGLTHNVDAGPAARLVMQYSYSHNANAGDLVKTEASENYILFNRLTSEQGTTNTELDLTNGGRSFVLGNLIEKGAGDLGANAVGYLLGGTSASNPSTELYVINNTFVNDKGGSIDFLNISAADPTAAVVTNNIFYGPGVVTTQSNAALTANLTANPLFVNQAGYDYHLSSGSPAINAGVNPGSADAIPLLPAYQYLDPTCAQARVPTGTPDIGAYEFGGAGAPLACALGVSGLTLNPTTVTGGTMVTANTITLSTPAPSSGTVVALTTSNPAVASAPASVTVPAGALSAGFSVTTAPVANSTSVTIAATYSGTSQSASLSVTAPAWSSLQCSPTSLSSGGVASCTVTLTGAAPAAGIAIALASNNTLLSVPASVTVAAGSASGSFSATAGTITSTQSATVTASLNGAAHPVTLTLTGSPGLTGLSCTPTAVTSRGSTTCMVTLAAPAPAQGTVVAVSDSSKLLSAPSSVTVPAGATSASFKVKAGRILKAQTATVTASLNGVSFSVTLQLSNGALAGIRQLRRNDVVLLAGIPSSPLLFSGPGVYGAGADPAAGLYLGFAGFCG